MPKRCDICIYPESDYEKLRIKVFVRHKDKLMAEKEEQTKYSDDLPESPIADYILYVVSSKVKPSASISPARPVMVFI